MSVYFVHCERSNAVKIGFAADPRKRFSKIQTDAPTKLRLLAVEEGDKAREAELHQRFAAYRTRGEWFRFAPTIQAHIAKLPTISTARPQRPKNGALGRWMVENNLTVRQLAAMIGANIATISQACNGTAIPNKATVRRIYEVSRGQVQPNDFYDLPELPGES